MQSKILARIIFGFIGLALLIGGAWSFQSTRSFVGRAITAPGKVVNLKASRSSSSSRRRSSSSTYAPVVSFRTVSGQEITFTSSVSSSPPAYDIGESVKVLYLESKPGEAKISSFFSLWLTSILLSVFGLALTALVIAPRSKHGHLSAD